MQLHSFPQLFLVGLFVIALVSIGVVVFLAIKLLNRKPGDGASSFSGCAVAAVIGCLGMLALGTAAVLFVGLAAYRAKGVAIRHIQRDAQGAESIRIEPIEPETQGLPVESGPVEASRHTIHFVFHLRGVDADANELQSIVRQSTGSQPSMVRGVVRDAQGRTYTRIELSVQLEEARVNDAENRVRAAVEASESGKSGAVEYEGLERDV
jgi:hypothetical protein